MTLRCKQGDLARIVGFPDALSDLRDKFVKCVELYYFAGQPVWKIDRRIDLVLRANGRSTFTGERYVAGDAVWIDSVPDKHLRPIRGDSGADITMGWIRTPAFVGEHPKQQVEFAR